jgi:nucleoside-diphosphate-sugar epimerase
VWGRDDTTALPQLVQAARCGQFAWIAGGNYLTSTTHIANLCSGIELALARGGAGEVYFLSDDAPVPFREFVSRMLETQNIRPPAKSVSRTLLRTIAVVGDILGKLSRRRIIAPLTLQSFSTSAVEITLSISKARKELGYHPVISHEQGLAEMRAANLAT